MLYVVRPEAILQVRAAVLCDDDRLRKHMEERPWNPYRPNVKIAMNTST